MPRLITTSGVLAPLLFLSTTAFAQPAAEQPARGPVPAWVKLSKIPDPDPKRAEAPVQILLLQGQTKFGAKEQEHYFEMVMRPQTVAGLQEFSTVTLPWNASRASLTVHAIEAVRDGKAIDLVQGKPFTILRREGKLEKAQLDGVRSVVLPVRGIELGDTIRISATYRTIPSKLTAIPEDLSIWDAPFHIVSLDRRFLVEPGVPMKWRIGGKTPKPVISQTASGTEYLFTERNVAPREYPKWMRKRDQLSDVQFSGYESWSAVGAAHAGLYEAARKTAPNSPLSLEAQKIAASTTDPRLRMMAALRLVQERVRYSALLLGDGAYAPTHADEAWDARFGDCKAKSALILALLDRLGIGAVPMYVSATAGDALGDRLPSLAAFDHVIVKATIDGQNYFLDGSDYGHRVPGDAVASDFRFGLPIKAGARLAEIPMVEATQPTVETALEWDGSRSLSGEVPFTARLVLRGPMAINARLKKASSTKDGEFDEFLKSYIRKIPDDKLTIISQKEDSATGDYIVEFNGQVAMEWDVYEDRKGARFYFSNDASKWEPDFDREKGAFKDAPVALNKAFWQRETETVALPASKGFSIDDAQPIDRTVAGTHIWRTVKLEGNRATSVTNFRHIKSEVPAAEARAALDEIGVISENWAYLVGPKKLLPKEQPEESGSRD